MFKKQRRRISSASSPKLSFEVLESRQLLAGLDAGLARTLGDLGWRGKMT